MVFAVNTGAVATPLLLVAAVTDAEPLNVALAPLDGAVNVTVAPLTALPPESLTVACKAVPNAVLTLALRTTFGQSLLRYIIAYADAYVGRFCTRRSSE